MIDFKNVSVAYEKKGNDALKNVNIHIDKGEFVFVVGQSGAGKSTFIKLLTKEIDPTKGTVSVDGEDLKKIKHRKVPMYRRKIGCIFQDFRLLPDRNVYENVAFAQRIIEAPKKDIKKKVPKMLALVGLAGYYKKNPGDISGGEQQRVAIARALINRPEILLADEPTGNLDDKNAWEIMELLEDINKRGTTVIVVTHNMNFVNTMKKRIIQLQHGIVIKDQKMNDGDVLEIKEEKEEKKEEETKADESSVDIIQL